ncbi:CKLF-like MARVEL transmembrane domain-containing protein 6 [Rhinophrynus dorsalis]
MSGEVYADTTMPVQQQRTNCCNISHLGTLRFIIKLLQVMLSFVAFICEEIIDECDSCGGLYFFEFVSCSALLLALLMVIVHTTPVRSKVNTSSLNTIDFCITLGVGVSFMIASIVFAATMDEKMLARVSVAFGFLASFAFLVELYFQWKSGKSPLQKKGNVNGNTTAHERQGLTEPPVQVQEPHSEVA